LVSLHQRLRISRELRAPGRLRQIARLSLCNGPGARRRGDQRPAEVQVSERTGNATGSNCGWLAGRWFNDQLASRSSAKNLFAPDHDADQQHQRCNDCYAYRQVGQKQAAGNHPSNEQSKSSHDQAENDAEPDHKRAPQAQAEWTDRSNLPAVVLR
jgi:hypothetical protein